jgi:hypothetical protein
MIVRCIGNDISFLALDSVKERLRWWMNSDGQYSDLEIGQRYAVQAVEYLDDGIWFQLHTIDVSEHPYPYASEFFVIEDSSLPQEWQSTFTMKEGNIMLKRITFREWAEDNLFYEKLIDGVQEYVSVYLSKKIEI